MVLDREQLEEIKRLLEYKAKELRSETKKKKRKKKDPHAVALAAEMEDIEHALKKLDEDRERFGFCEKCFMEIPWGELVENPARRYCSRCSGR